MVLSNFSYLRLSNCNIIGLSAKKNVFFLAEVLNVLKLCCSAYYLVDLYFSRIFAKISS